MCIKQVTRRKGYVDIEVGNADLEQGITQLTAYGYDLDCVKLKECPRNDGFMVRFHGRVTDLQDFLLDFHGGESFGYYDDVARIMVL